MHLAILQGDYYREHLAMLSGRIMKKKKHIPRWNYVRVSVGDPDDDTTDQYVLPTGKLDKELFN